MERIVPDVTEALLYSKRIAVAFWGMAALNVGPSTSSAAMIWANSSTLTVTVVIVL